MVKQHESANALKFLTVKEVAEKIGLSRSTVYEKMGSDPTFPKKIKVGSTAKNAAVRFVESEVNAWMALQVQAGRLAEQSERDPSDVIEKTVTTAPAYGTGELTKAKEQRASGHLTTISQLLEKNARTGKCISYEQAMAAVRLWADKPEDREIFEEVLEKVARASHAENKGLLSVLVHEHVGSSGRPSATFFRLAKKLGYSYEDADAFVDHEIRRLYQLYEDQHSLHKHRKLMWVETRGKRMLTRLKT